MDAALKRLDVSASAVIEQLLPSAGIVLVTDRETCVVAKCGGNLVQTRDQLRAQPRDVVRPTIYTDRGVLSGELFWKRCERCDARHYLSYAVSGYHVPSGQLLPYPGCESAEWTHVTEHEVWQTTLLKRYRQQLLHSHTAADAYMREYAGLHETRLPVAQRKHLSHVWLSWELVAWLQELGEAATPIEIGSIAGLDVALLRLTQATPLRDVAITECGPLFSHPPHTCMCKRDSKFQFTIPGYRLFAPEGREADREASERLQGREGAGVPNSSLYMVGLRGVANPGVGREQRTAQAYPGGVGTPAGRTVTYREATA
jgi:hypothetical protein